MAHLKEAAVGGATRREMFPLRWWQPMALFLFAYALRLFHVGRVVSFLDDRWMNVPTAINYSHYGFIGPDNWFTQPIKHLLMYASISAFGNDPSGWGMRQILFGSGIVVMTYLLARRVFRVHFPALFAALALALDPLNIAFSRASSEDPIAVVLILCALFFWVRALQEERSADWVATGIFIGLASATRWYALLVAVILVLAALVARRRDSRATLLGIFAALTAVPLAVYVAAFLPWMARGNGLRDLWSLQVDSYLVQQTSSYPAFDPALAVLTGPGGWFTRWIGAGTPSGDGVFTIIMNDPVLWVAFVPSIGYLAWVGYKRRLPEYWTLAVVFIGLYLFFVSVDRPIYLYSALTVVPFGFMAMGFAAGRLLGRYSLAVLAFVVVWGLYLYPLVSAIQVPISPYGWLLVKFGLGGGA